MFRKTILALTAIAALATTVVVVPTSADAGWRGRHHGHHFNGHRRHGFGWYGPALIGSAIIGSAIIANSCYQRRWVETPYGPRKVRVNVC